MRYPDYWLISYLLLSILLARYIYLLISLSLSASATVLACIPPPFGQEVVLLPAVWCAAYHDALRRDMEDRDAAAYYEIFA